MELLVTIIILALIFDYINGFHDAANSIATIVSTRVLTPFKLYYGLLSSISLLFHCQIHYRRIRYRQHSIQDGGRTIYHLTYYIGRSNSSHHLEPGNMVERYPSSSSHTLSEDLQELPLWQTDLKQFNLISFLKLQLSSFWLLLSEW